MNVPENLKYTKEHEWVLVDGDTATVGITEYAQGELGDIVFIELPQEGDNAAHGEPCANIEAVKAVSDLYSPVTGEIVAVNSALEGDPQIINKDSFGDGWILKVAMTNPAELEELMDAATYKDFIS